MAPIITAGELLIKPIEATIIEQIKIQIFIDENSISLLISSTVLSLSTPSYIENKFFKKLAIDPKACFTENLSASDLIGS